MLSARVSPAINLAFNQDELMLSGEVAIPYARIKVRALPEAALSPSEDVVFINQAQQAEPSTKLGLNLKVKIDEQKNNNVKLDAFGLTSDLQGEITLRKEKQLLIGEGDVQIVNGRYRAYGQDLIIRTGDILFSGPIQSPILDIEAIRDPIKTADDVIAGIQVQGNAEQPELSIFTEPDMEQAQALSYLLRGLSIDSSSETSTDSALADALLSFGLSKSENKITKTGKKLGIVDLTVSTTGQGDETKLAVSGYVTQDVQLRYGVGVFDSASEIALRYQIMPKLYLEAVSGLNNALDLYYKVSIDDKAEIKKAENKNIQ